MCTTSAECKTVITAVLTVMSSMDPHMISWNLRWDGLVGFVEVGFFRLWVGHGETPWCDRVCYLRGDEFATCLLDLLRHTISPLLSASQTKSQAILVESLHVIFSHTCWVATISLLKLASIVALGQTKHGSPTKSISRSQKIKTRHASPLVVPVEATPALRFPPLLYSVIFFLAHRSFCKILSCNLLRYCICSPYC